MKQTDKIRPTDTRILNDLDQAHETAKAFHDNNAAKEAQKLADRYRDSPVYLKLLAMHITGQADKAYSRHMQELEEKKPRRDIETQELFND